MSKPVAILVLLLAMAMNATADEGMVEYETKLLDLKSQHQQQQQQLQIHQAQSQQHQQLSIDSMGPATNDVDHYEYSKLVFIGVQRALNECRQRFKWDRWDCPMNVFHSIVQQNKLDNNREVAFSRAIMSASIALIITQNCAAGRDGACRCNRHPPQVAPPTPPTAQGRTGGRTKHHDKSSALGRTARGQHQNQAPPAEDMSSATISSETNVSAGNTGSGNKQQQVKNAYRWNGCDDDIHFGFQISHAYLEPQDNSDTNVQNSASTITTIDSHNFRAGRMAVKNTMEKKCKCHGVSGSCQLKTCWMRVSDLSKVGAYLRRQYKHAAKVGGPSAQTTTPAVVSKDLTNISSNKLVFVDSSPDYCYENTTMGISGTLGRYCSRNRYDVAQQKETSSSERHSCDRLCTKCGYKIHTVETIVEKPCHCKFKFCCSVECRQCRKKEQIHRCVSYA